MSLLIKKPVNYCIFNKMAAVEHPLSTMNESKGTTFNAATTTSDQKNSFQQKNRKMTKFMLRYFPPGFIIEYEEQINGETQAGSHCIDLQNILNSDCEILVDKLQSEEALLSELNRKVLIKLVQDLQVKISEKSSKFSLISSQHDMEGILDLDTTKHADIYLTTSPGGNIKLYKSQNSQMCGLMTNDTGDAMCAKFIYPSNQKFVTGDSDGKIKLWDIEKSAVISTFDKHQSQLSGFVLSPLSSFAVSFSSDGQAFLWDLPDCQLIAALPKTESPIKSMKFDGSGMLLTSLEESGSMRTLDLSTQNVLGSLKFSPNTMNRIDTYDFAWDGSFIAAGNRKGHVIAYSPDFKHQDCLYKHNSPVSEVKVSSMVQSIISTSQQSDFISFHQVYNRSTARVDCKAKVSGIHFGAKGDSIYVNYENIGSTIYNLKMAEIQTLKTIEKPTQIRFSYDGDSCIIADEENYCYVYGH